VPLWASHRTTSADLVPCAQASHWHTSITEEEYHRRLQELDSPLYTHVGGTAMAEETVER